jgi:uncharacterized protein (DUF1778 family)
MTYNSHGGGYTHGQITSERRGQEKKLPSPLLVRLDEESKALLAQAAGLRRISVSDYVRTVPVSRARKEVLASREQTISLTPEEQLAFWTALSETLKLTPSQKRLAGVSRGES